MYQSSIKSSVGFRSDLRLFMSLILIEKCVALTYNRMSPNQLQLYLLFILLSPTGISIICQFDIWQNVTHPSLHKHQTMVTETIDNYLKLLNVLLVRQFQLGSIYIIVTYWNIWHFDRWQNVTKPTPSKHQRMAT